MATKHIFWLCLLISTLAACRKTDIENDQALLVLQATVPADPAATVDIDQTVGTITVSPSTFRPDRVRSNWVPVHFTTTPNSVLVPLDLNETQPLNKKVSIDVMSYDNDKPIRMIVRSENSSRSVYKQYQLQLRAAGPVRFESVPALKDTMVISLKYYQNYLISLPVSNLYDGHPQDYRVYATLAGSTLPIELAPGYDRYSQDYVQFYVDQRTTKPGVYTIELRKADGQRVISPTRIVVDNSK